jgi:ABC-type glutathione transport system ATPase component
MWADNETTVDLLGFDYLVDALELIVTDTTMLPVTVGMAGDWGSGKTSVMRMAEERLDPRTDIVTVSFSPWRFEGYDDIKAALMAAVIGCMAALTEAARLCPTSSEVYRAAGNAQWLNGEKEAAIEALRRSVRLDWHNRRAHEQLFSALAGSNRLQEALGGMEMAAAI